MKNPSNKFTPFWWALQLKNKKFASKPNKGRCMFCGITTTKEEKNLCNTCFQLGEQEFKQRRK
jgi:hypothetical protein